MPSLRIEVGGQTFVAHLPEAAVRVGRDPECDLRINDPDVSATHLTLEPLLSGLHKLTDANSGRPTRVNGVVVKRVSLQPGDVVEVGPARLTYLVDESIPAPASAAVAPPVWAAPSPPPSPAPVEAPSVAVVARAVAVASPAPAATRAPDPVAAEPAASTAVAAAPSPRAPRSRSARRLTVALLALAGVTAAAFLAASYLGSGNDPEAAAVALRRDFEKATDLWHAGDFDGAAALYRKIAGTRGAGETSAKAERYLAQVQSQIEEGDREFERLRADRMALEPSEAQVRFDELKSRLGESIAARHKDLVARMAAEQRKWLDDRKPATEALAASRAKEGHFAQALAAWDAFRSEAPVVDESRRDAEDGRAAVAALAGEALKDLVRQASAVEAREGPQAAADFLRGHATEFAGTPAAVAIEYGASSYEREANRLSPPAAVSPGPGTPGATRPKPPTATKPGTRPGAAPPSLPPAERARLGAILADAEAKAAGRQFGAAVAALDDALTLLPKGAPDVARVAGRRDDLALARDGLDLLGKTIREHPERFTGIGMNAKSAVDLVDADADFLIALVRGGRTPYRWAEIEPARVAVIADRTRVPAKESLPLAGLLHESGAKDAAERALLRLVEEGGDAAVASAHLARWRGEPLPAGGYVAYEGRLVSPAERERIVVDARIAQAIGRVGDTSAAARKAAVQELLSLGEPAREPLKKALAARRAAAIQDVAAMKTFTSGRTRTKLQQELSKRRAAALALIEDAGAYPYPSATHQGQEEVDRLVDQVRDVWERPFDLIASWDKGVAESMTAVNEVDEALAKVEEGYKPDLDAVKAAVNKAVDLPDHLMTEYSRKVLAYNEKVATSATREERDNVLAVNEYRMMMGREAVKIDERLERAARGHSIEMRMLKYFEHSGKTPETADPGKRCAREGYASGVGENIASGTPTGRDAFNAWFHSSGHHRNMISKSWTEMGAGRSGGSLWTQNFGGMTGNNLKGQDALPPLRPEIAPEPDEGEPPPAAKKGKGKVGEKPPPGPPPEKPPPEPGMAPNGG